MQYGLIGKKLGHSFSKEIHEQIENYTYTLKELTQEELDAFMQSKAFKAINVTIPYKETVIPYLDHLSNRAAKIGAVNTIVNHDGKLYGYNTDCLGLKALIDKACIDLKNKKVVVLGTGGTQKTAVAVAQEAGAEKVICVSRCEKEGAVTYDKMYESYSDSDIIINTTPCGMYPDCNSSPVDIDRFPNLVGVVDVIYNPLRTRLVSDALKRGIKATGGLYMLVSQAVFAAEKFTGKTYEHSVIDNIYRDINAEKENIVLIGMPASGKSTVGKQLAKITGREFIDTDEMIVNLANMPITDIFTKHGEEVFRDMESRCVDEVSKKNGCVIATGGGVILRRSNVDALYQNGRLYFLDRLLDELVPTQDRPLASDVEAIKKRYEERYPIYTAVADQIIKIDDNAEVIAQRILSLHSKGGTTH